MKVVSMQPVKIKFFKSADEFRKWLGKNHGEVLEVWLGFYKKDSGRGGITYTEALDEALCFGWIDGIRKGIDGSSYVSRFTPRKSRSIWSTVNTKRAGELRGLGRMMPTGLKALAARDPERSGIYAFENRARKLEPDCEQKFKANKKAWEFFQLQAPWYRRTAGWWVFSAKREETKWRRLERLIGDSQRGARLAHLTSPSKRPK
jgi:uncharacterized protein YdeI (YjbR/CyaY-like superfamily)